MIYYFISVTAIHFKIVLLQDFYNLDLLYYKTKKKDPLYQFQKLLYHIIQIKSYYSKCDYYIHYYFHHI